MSIVGKYLQHSCRHRINRFTLTFRVTLSLTSLLRKERPNILIITMPLPLHKLHKQLNGLNNVVALQIDMKQIHSSATHMTQSRCGQSMFTF